MLNAGVPTFKEFVIREPLPLATIHEAVLEFVRGRDDAVVFGATAVNAYVAEARMTQDIDLMSPRAAELAEEMRAHLSERFHVAVRVRVIGEGKGYRLFQIQKTGDRHLVDVRFIESLPRAQRIEDILVISSPRIDCAQGHVLSFGVKGNRSSQRRSRIRLNGTLAEDSRHTYNHRL